MADGSARDRAIETVMAGVDPGCGCEVAAAGAAVDLLAARPAVLRALAGTPAEPLDVLALTAVLTEALEWEDSCIEWQGENDAAGVATFLASWLDAAGYTVTAAAPVAPGVAAEPTTDRVDVYVRARNVLRAGMRTAEVADGVTVDWQTDHHGVEHVVGVEVLAARGVEINGQDTQTGRPHGTGPEWKPNGSAPAGPPVAGPPAPAAEPTPADTCNHGRSIQEPCNTCTAEDVPRERDRIMLAAEWRTLIHNVHKVGEHGWHWRCGVAEFRDEACQYDQRTDSYQAMVTDSLFHLRRYHDITPAAPAAVGTTPPADELRRLTDAADGLESVLYDLDAAAPRLRQLVKRRICIAQEALRAIRAGAAPRDTASESGGEQ